MIDYEIVLLLDPELPDERQNEIVTRTRELVEGGGERQFVPAGATAENADMGSSAADDDIPF